MARREVITEEIWANLPTAAMDAFDGLPMAVRRERIKAVVGRLGLSLSKRLWYELGGHSDLYELEPLRMVLLMVEFREAEEVDTFLRGVLGDVEQV